MNRGGVVRRSLRRPLVWWRHRGVRPDDLILGEYPKSGSTWLAFMLAEATLGRSVDFESQRSVIPGVGMQTASTPLLASGGRLLRTHERCRPEYERSIYLVRHVGDVAVSYFHWLRWLALPEMEFKDFLPRFLSGRMDSYGPWASHVDSWVTDRRSKIVVRYEDLRADPTGTLSTILSRLGEPATEARVAQAVQGNTIPAMREKEASARRTVFRGRSARDHFVRSGAVGESGTWLDEQDLALIERAAGPTLRSLGYEVRPQPRP